MSCQGVLLVQAPARESAADGAASLFMPMGILLLGTFLHSWGIRVKLLDGRLGNDFESAVFGTAADVDVVGFSVMTDAFPSALRATRVLRQRGFDGRIVWGGPHPTMYPKQILQDPDIDFVVRGYGEMPILEIVRPSGIAPGQPTAIPGLGVRSKKGWDCGLGVPTVLPAVPEYDLLDVEVYIDKVLPLSGRPSRVARVLTSRGCPYRCTFCINSVTEYGWSPKRLDDIEKDVRFVTQKLRCDHVNVLDELPFPSVSRAIAFGELASSVADSVTWSANMAVKDILREAGQLRTLRRLGLTTIVTGAESGSDQVLVGLGKRMTADDVIRAAEACLRAGIRLVISFMVGVPGEERGDIQHTMALVERLQTLSEMVRVVGPQLYRPYPGTPLFEQHHRHSSVPSNLEELSDAIEAGTLWVIETMPWIKEPELVAEIAREYDLYWKRNR